MSAATIAPPRFQLEIAAPKMLTAKEEIKLLREAYERNFRFVGASASAGFSARENGPL